MPGGAGTVRTSTSRARVLAAMLATMLVAGACSSTSQRRDIRDPYLERLRAFTNEAIDVMAEIDGAMRRGATSEAILFTTLTDIRVPHRLAVTADKVSTLDPPPGFVADHEVVTEAFLSLRDIGRDFDAAIAAEDLGDAVVALVVLRDMVRHTAISVTPETCGSVTPGGGYGLCDPPPQDPWEAAVFGALLPIAARYEVLASGHLDLTVPPAARLAAIEILHPTAIALLEASRDTLASATPPEVGAADHLALLEYLADLVAVETEALAVATSDGADPEADPTEVRALIAFDETRHRASTLTCDVAELLRPETRALASGWFDDPGGNCAG